MSIVLIGMRGAGKTTVGRLLAERLGWRFIDTDELIVAAANMSVREIFEREGEPAFRARERVAVAEAVMGRSTAPVAGPESRRSDSSVDRIVLSVGGGAVMDAANRAALQAADWVVWLTASPGALARRIEADAATRPPLTTRGALDELRRSLAQRKAVYAGMADLTLDSEAASASTLAERIADALQRPP